MSEDKRTVGRPIMTWEYSYHDLAKATGKTVNSIQASRRRPGGFNPENLVSLVLWVCRNAPPELKRDILTHASSIQVVVDNKSRRTGRR